MNFLQGYMFAIMFVVINCTAQAHTINVVAIGSSGTDAKNIISQMDTIRTGEIYCGNKPPLQILLTLFKKLQPKQYLEILFDGSKLKFSEINLEKVEAVIYENITDTSNNVMTKKIMAFKDCRCSINNRRHAQYGDLPDTIQIPRVCFDDLQQKKMAFEKFDFVMQCDHPQVTISSSFVQNSFTKEDFKNVLACNTHLQELKEKYAAYSELKYQFQKEKLSQK